MESNYSNVTSHNNSTSNSDEERHIVNKLICVIVSISLPLILAAIYSLYSQVKNNNVAPIFIINLLISDIIQLCYMIVEVEKPKSKVQRIFFYIYCHGLLASVGFMVCIALERYLLIAWPLWYRFKSTIKSALLVCAVVWTLPLVYVLPSYFGLDKRDSHKISAVFFLVPFPLFIFFLGGTLKALSAAISVSSDEKRRIVGILVLVLLIYTLLFVPIIIFLLVEEARNIDTYYKLSLMFLRFCPLADLILYVFMMKGVIDKLLASLCCCRKDKGDITIST